MTATPEDILFVQPETLQRLIAQERVSVSDIDQQAVYRFSGNDFQYPNRVVRTSVDVMHNSVHLRTPHASGDADRHAYLFVADI